MEQWTLLLLLHHGPSDFNRGISHENIVCEVCSQKPDNRTEGQSEGRVSSSSGMDPNGQIS